jgi:hypothetical protein
MVVSMAIPAIGIRKEGISKEVITFAKTVIETSKIPKRSNKDGRV